MEPDITLAGVGKSVGDLEILRDIDVEVGRGEAVAIVGPTGCGKTTTLRIVGGFDTDYRGEVRLLGQPAAGLPPQRRPTRTVFQDYGLFPNMTVFGNVAYGLRVRRLPEEEIRRKVASFLELVRLSGYERKSVQTLSGGERQRVAFARVLVTEPKIVLLDEPFSAIDEALRATMELELRQIQQRLDLTFVLVTHNQGEAMALADRLVVMSKGRVAQIGTGQDVYRRPRTRFVANFLGEANLLELTDVAEGGGRDADGPLLIADTAGRRGAVAACIRPEAVAVGEAALAQVNRRRALVENVVFRGPVTKLVLRTEGGQQLGATMLNNGAPVPAQGDTVDVGWAPEQISVLAGDD